MLKLLSGMVLMVCVGVAGCSGAQGGPVTTGPVIGRQQVVEDAPVRAPPALEPADWKKPAAASSGPLVIHTDPGELPRLQLARDASQELSLEHTHVSAKLHGFVAEVEVTQTYANPFKDVIEAVYVFPLPENSAVNHLRMVIDRRVIEAEIKERGQAQRMYQDAKRAGHTAALLEQERPNIFMQSVANIEPGKKIDVVVRYLQDLTYDAGKYEFIFPMVVGPRYMPGGAAAVPDASRISPPYVGKGERSGRTISLELVADARGVVGDFEVPTHDVVSRRPADGTLRLNLAEKASIPNRDFVLRYGVAGPAPKASMALSPDGYFSLVVQPPELDVESLVGQRELVFVVDVSGSMSGEPLELCKAAMRDALGRLRPVDTFNILTFSGKTERAFERSRPANTVNLGEGLRVVSEMSAGGGTELADAVAAALKPDSEAGRNRYVFFLTDGFVGNEDQIITGARDYVKSWKGGKARVFGFGVGSSPNRYLLDGLSRAGQGVAIYATNREDPVRGVDRFFHYVDRAVLQNLRVSWGGLNVVDALPSPIPDLFASRPVMVHGRYRGTATGPVTVHADVNGRSVDLPVDVQAASADLGAKALGTLWARQKITSLEHGLMLGAPGVEEQITELGLAHHLVTRFTSLIAIDSARTVGDGKPRKVREQLDWPEGIDVEAAGGEVARAELGIGTCPTCVDYGGPSPAPPPSAEQVYAVERRRGCGCRAVGATEPTPWAGALAFLGVSGLLARRRRR